jgi:thiamine biosynthesis lipoprotein
LHDAVVGTPVAVDAWTFDCAALSLELARASSGAFDPVLPSSGGSAGHVEVIGDGALLRHAPVIVDLGGVAKGFAVDRAIDALRAFGCSSGVVNAGGDVRVFGRATMVWVRGPSACRQVEMADEALAVTDFDVADRPAEHRGYYLHGRPRAVRGMAAVRAQSAAVADALTKIVGVAECFLDEQALFQRYDARVLVAPERCP